MVHKYIEMIEEDYDEETEIPYIIRLPVSTDEDAELIYANNKTKFKQLKAGVIEGDHIPNGQSKPCKTYKFKDGKVDRNES